MTDEDILCDYCGKAYSPQGISMHEQHCDENPENQDEADSDEADDGGADPGGGSVFTDLSEDGEAVLERSDGTCQLCEDEDVEVLHKLIPDGEQVTRNLVGLCESCDGKLEGLHPRTKRSKVYHQ